MNVFNIKKIYNSYVFFSLAFIILSFQIITQHRSNNLSQSIELLVEMVSTKETKTDPLTRDDLFRLTQNGGRIAEELNDKWVLPSESQYIELGFNNENIENGYISIANLRSLRRSQCKILLIKKQSKGRFDGYSPSYLGGNVARFQDPIITFFDASDCLSGYHVSFPGIMLSSSDDSRDDFYILPQNIVKNLNNLLLPSPPFDRPYFEDRLGFIKNNSDGATKLFPELKNGYLVSEFAIRLMVITEVSKITGKKYNTLELQKAIDDLFTTNNRSATFAGISAPLEILVSIAPIFLLLLLWQMYRQSKISKSISKEEYWILTDVNDGVGIGLAVLYAIFPYILAIISAVMFCAATQLYGVYFGYHLIINENLQLTMTEALPRGWWKPQSRIDVLVGLIWWLHIYLSLRLAFGYFDTILYTIAKARRV